MKTLFAFGLCMFAATLTVRPALAQTGGLPTGVSDIFNLYDHSGALVLSKSALETTEPALIDTGVPGNPAVGPIVFTEPGPVAGKSIISDIFGTLAPSPTSTAPPTLGFMSDDDSGGGLPTTALSAFIISSTGTTTIDEPAGPFDVTQFLGANVPTGYTATFQSDPVDVPEPSTLGLLGAGGAGLVCYRWRRRRYA